MEIGLQHLAKIAQVYETAIINPTLNLTQNHTLVQKKKTLSSPQNIGHDLRRSLKVDIYN